ncbi:17912_t:CDS:2 [Cetraspora pellucida]|uniref:17912_t:CDS:1 n=1 Tax=Cetraspora pellucida TaxID=1433469 RepID=A0A9N9NPP9_9GLOM|nr:17912_t:CDS:2 [Cetraspora pellucida]
MSEVSTGRSSFERTPDIYIKLAKQYIDKGPIKRPTAKEVYEKSQEWEIILNKEQGLN